MKFIESKTMSQFPDNYIIKKKIKEKEKKKTDLEQITMI